jgi:hypothetical protein
MLPDVNGGLQWSTMVHHSKKKVVNNKRLDQNQQYVIKIFGG